MKVPTHEIAKLIVARRVVHDGVPGAEDGRGELHPGSAREGLPVAQAFANLRMARHDPRVSRGGVMDAALRAKCCVGGVRIVDEPRIIGIEGQYLRRRSTDRCTGSQVPHWVDPSLTAGAGTGSHE